jgi:RNA polymerase sigma-70 factor (ECF subfamily)
VKALMTSVAIQKLEQVSDGDLALAMARGSQEALAEAYRRHSGAVRAIARRAGARADLAEEAVQDVFLTLWMSPERFHPDRGSLRSFLQVQAHRRAIDIGRSEAARHRRECQDAQRDRPVSDDVERQVLDAAIAGQVHDAMAGLHPRERQALELAYLRGHSYRQVATLLGQPEGTVKNRIRAGLRRLRTLLPQADSPFSELPLA